MYPYIVIEVIEYTRDDKIYILIYLHFNLKYKRENSHIFIIQHIYNFYFILSHFNVLVN